MSGPSGPRRWTTTSGSRPAARMRSRVRSMSLIEDCGSGCDDRGAQRLGEHPRVAERAEDAGRDDQAHRACISSPALRQTNASAPDADQLRRLFDAPAPLTVGLEEELMLLHPATLDLVPLAPDVLAACDGDPRFKLELPASQLEIMLPPLGGADEAAAALAAARAQLAERAQPLATPHALALHPF